MYYLLTHVSGKKTCLEMIDGKKSGGQVILMRQYGVHEKNGFSIQKGNLSVISCKNDCDQ